MRIHNGDDQVALSLEKGDKRRFETTKNQSGMRTQRKELKEGWIPSVGENTIRVRRVKVGENSRVLSLSLSLCHSRCFSAFFPPSLKGVRRGRYIYIYPYTHIYTSMANDDGKRTAGRSRMKKIRDEQRPRDWRTHEERENSAKEEGGEFRGRKLEVGMRGLVYTWHGHLTRERVHRE